MTEGLTKSEDVARKLRYIVTLILPILTILYVKTYFAIQDKFATIFLFLSVMVTFLTMLIEGKKGWGKNLNRQIFLWVCAVISLGLGIYFYSQYLDLVYYRVHDYNTLDNLCALLAIILVTIVTWKETGSSIPILLFGFLAYLLLGPVLPGIFRHQTSSIERVLGISMLEMTGFSGMLTALSATVLMMFVLFASFMQAGGGMDALMSLLARFAMLYPSWVLAVPVVGSMIFGMFSGSILANIVAVGSFTIPLMIKAGLKRPQAAGVEICASTGGQIMPPVLGASAFIMAQYLQVPYARVMEASLLGAFIYYGNVFVASRWLCKEGKSIDLNLLESMAHAMSVKLAILRLAPLFLSLGLFVYLSVVLMLDVLPASTYMLFCSMALELVRRLLTSKGIGVAMVGWFKQILDGFSKGGLQIVPMVGMLAVMQVLDSVLTATGLGQNMSIMMLEISGKNFYLLILMGYLGCILFGLAITTVSSYILTVLLIAPALNEFGLPPIATHFFVFYAALLAGLSPPAAPNVVAGAAIAGSGYWDTFWESCKLALPMFMLPFMFVSTPDLLSLNWAGVKVFFIAASATISISYGVYFSRDHIPIRLLVGLLGAGILGAGFVYKISQSSIIYLVCLLSWGIMATGMKGWRPKGREEAV